jgi:hypothetical protein
VNKTLLNKILQLPNRRNIVTKIGVIQDLHKIMTIFYDESDWCRELYIYILEDYNTFKVKK